MKSASESHDHCVVGRVTGSVTVIGMRDISLQFIRYLTVCLVVSAQCSIIALQLGVGMKVLRQYFDAR